MGFFGKKDEGGLMDVIRCDEPDYMLWKWTPSGHGNNTNKENAIRWGSSLRVKDGEVAVFVYKKNDGTIQDFIVGPHDETLKTANFPVLTSILGLAFDGKSPFQAEVYFINLAGNVQLKFAVPYFDVFDPRFSDFAVPMAARGSIIFNITDYKGFIKLHRLINFNIEDFSAEVKDVVIKYVKGVISNAPAINGIPVLQIERKILEINDILKPKIQEVFEQDFGVNLKRFDLSAIEVKKDSDGYLELRKVTAVQQTKTIDAQTSVSIKNLEDTQAINALNMADTLRIQREESQRLQRLQTETQFISAHQLNQQADVLKTAASSLGAMGDTGGGGGLNPAGMMTGMMLGGAMGGQMANMANQIGQNLPQPGMTPPPPPPAQAQYSISVNGQTSGPFTWAQLQQMIQGGSISKETHMWKQGMANWEIAGNIQELSVLFGSMTPPPPPMS